MACGCSSTSSSSMPIPFLTTGGGGKKKRNKRRSSSRKNTSRKSRSNHRKRSKSKRRKSQKGGIGLFGTVSSNAVNVSNNLTGTHTNDSAAHNQPAGRSYSNLGNPYMV